METVYLVCAAIGGTMIVCQFLMTILGLGAHHDVGGHDGGGDVSGHDAGGHDSGHDAAGHHETGSHSEPNWFFSMLTFRTLTASFAFFGLTGLTSIRFELDPAAGFALAVAAGAGAFFGVAYLMRFMSRLNVDGTVRIERAIGSHGTVYLSIPGSGSGIGKVHVTQLDRTVEYNAITAHDQLPTGAKIVVVRIVNGDTVEVVGRKSEVGSQKSEANTPAF